MTRHGKNCTAGAVYTYHEKKKDTGTWCDQKTPSIERSTSVVGIFTSPPQLLLAIKSRSFSRQWTEHFNRCIFTYTRIRLFAFVYVCVFVSIYCAYNMWICNILFIMLIYFYPATVCRALSLECGKLRLQIAQNPLFLNILISLEWYGQIFVIKLLLCDIWWHVGLSP